MNPSEIFDTLVLYAKFQLDLFLKKKVLGKSNFARFQLEDFRWIIPLATVTRWSVSLQWRHNGHDSVSNHQPHDCLLNHLFRRRSKKTSKLRVTGLCVGNSPGTSEFPAQMASNVENVSIWWRHHDTCKLIINWYLAIPISMAKCKTAVNSVN